MPNTFINERHRKYSEACRKAIEETSKQPYSAEDMIERCLRNLGIEESMVETAYIMSQPDLAEAIKKGEVNLKNGNYEIVEINGL